MPSFFQFQQGTESRARLNTDSSPLLGRFRAVPDTSAGRRRSRGYSGSGIFGTFSAARIGEVVFGNASEDGSETEGEVDEGGSRVGRVLKKWRRKARDLWLEPKQADVRRTVDIWWSRWAVLAVMPAALAVAWCALPFPQYELPDDDDATSLSALGHKVPGHGEARVEINFWFFLFVYYGFYNVTALMWITKVFNIYSLNWWPQSLGFPFTVSIIAAISILVPIPIYFLPESHFLTIHNTSWICWTFFTMAMPLLIAFAILLNHERHLGLRNSLSETQRIFTSSWWTGDTETLNARDRPRRPHIQQSSFDPNAPLEVALATDNAHLQRERRLALRKRWLPASFVRFIWFCLALFIGMMAYVLGEVYAETYLRTLPHDTYETIFYVYSWVVTVHLLDGLVGWILGGNEGERVGSYPLGWIFKLYFSVTYQTYVRALYARLRSPAQFIYLQVISSSFLILLAPLTMSKPFHYFLTLISINNQALPSYQKFCARNIFIRGLAENVSMIAFLGSVVVLHYGSNKDVYPYFAFDQAQNGTSPSTVARNSTFFTPSLLKAYGSQDAGGGAPFDGGESYDFGLTFYASTVTWACEICAGWVVRRILWFGWKMDVTGEGKSDLGMWPELLPTGVVVMVHVLQNMLFSIVRLKFH